ncbi:MAG TPA: serine hydrolase domain-containing protein [Edaphobacter sp.]|nr:serine hydrolase domain-containing protein [Edaphobacter sp.]
MNRRFFLAGTTSAALLTPIRSLGSQRVAGGIHPPGEEFLAQLPTPMELATLPGLGMAVIGPGKPTWQHYAGVANFNTKASITPDSLFPGCSLGKPIFACLVLQLAQEKKLDLDRPLNSYLQDDALTGRWGDRVTIRHVLCHTTGLPNWRGEKDQRLTPAFEPGSRFGYSGEGFFHLQRIVEHVTGIGFEAMMQERVFQPLQMRSSTFLWLPDAKDRLVAGHRGTDPFYNRDLPMDEFEIVQSSGKPISFWTTEELSDALMKKFHHTPGPSEFVPNVAFSLLTTVSDYTRFLSALLDPSDPILGLSPATKNLMWTPVARINAALSWGLGIGIETTSAANYLWQWGDNGGWKNFILAHPPSRTALAIFTNGSNGQRVNERVARAATGVDHPAFLWV